MECCPPFLHSCFIPPLKNTRLLYAILFATAFLHTHVHATAQDASESLKFANGLYQQRRYDLAADEFQKFLKENPKASKTEIANATYAYATCRLFLGQYSDARKAFEEFLTKSPDHPNFASAQFRAGETAYLMGDMDHAQSSLKLFLEKSPVDHPQRDSALVYAGDISIRQEKPDAAIDFYKKALDQYPTGRLTTRAIFGLGRSFALKQRHKEALDQFEKLLSAGGAEWNDRALYQIIQEQIALGLLGESSRSLEALTKASPNGPLVPESRWKLAEALLKAGKPDDALKLLEPLALTDPPTPISIQATSRMAGLLLERQKGAEAKALLQPLLKKIDGQPLSAGLLYQLAESELITGNKVRAGELFKQLADRFPQDTWADDARLRAADLATESKQYDTARNLLTQLLKDSPKSPLADDARLLLARMEASDGKPIVAVSILEPLVKSAQRPDLKSSAIYQLALAYQAMGKPDKAQALLAGVGAEAMPSGNAESLLLLGQSAFESKNYTIAIEALSNYLKTTKPRLADHALSWLAIAQWETGKKTESAESLKRLIATYPQSDTLVPTLIRLGESALESKSPELAATWLENAATLSTDKKIQARAYTDLGYAYTELKRPADSAKAFANAADRSAGDLATGQEATMAASKVLTGSGKFDEALEQIEKLLAADKSARSALNREALVSKARLLTRLGRPADSVKAYAELDQSYLSSAQEPTLPALKDQDQILSEWAYALMDSGNPAQADTIFQKLLTAMPASKFAAEAKLNLAESAYSAKKYTDACKLLSQLVKTPRPTDMADPLREAAIYRSARAELEQKNWDRSREFWNQLRSEFPKTLLAKEAAFWLGEIAARTDHPEEAVKILNELITSLSPAESPAWATTASLRRIQALSALKRWEMVLKSADQMMANPEFSKNPEIAGEVFYLRGRAFQSTAKFDESRKSYQNAIDARPTGDISAKSQFMRGETYFHEKNYREALREFLKVDILHDVPTWQANALLEAGKVYEQLNQPTDAADLYERLVERFPKEAAATEAKNRIGAVKATASSKLARPAS